MVGVEIYTNNRLIQLTDKLETICVLRKATPDELTSSSGPHDSYPRIYALNSQWMVAPISKVSIPQHGVGLEVYDEQGKMKFSSLAKLVCFEKYYDVNTGSAGKGSLRIAGKSGHRYGMIKTRSMGYFHNTNIRSYIDPDTWDEVWTFKRYSERYVLVDDVGGLTFEYRYEFLGERGWLDKYASESRRFWINGTRAYDRRFNVRRLNTALMWFFCI
ncbi:phage protein [Proteus mirabilis]|uniref:Phage protein n=1 Tax=Proteus mirabilis TaxID=584 RepID=A0A379FH80_PROMI|nr:phage protein [Proteus mirabilis]